MTDIHHGPFVSTEYINKVIDKVNSIMPDLVVLTGDFVDSSSAYVKPVVNILTQLKAKYGMFAVLGNHDHKADAKMVRKKFCDQDIPVIENKHQLIEKDGEAICIAGVGDLSEDIQDLKSALKGIPNHCQQF